MLEECWMKFYIVQMCHSACFNQDASPFILSFNVKSKIATDMLLPVILSELVKSNDEKPRRSRTREWISFLNLTFLCYFFLYCILSLVCLLFIFPLSPISSAASSYSFPFCSCKLDRWSESSLLLVKLNSIWCVWFFYCYYFTERLNFVESFEIWSSNIRSDVRRMKSWMKQRVNQSNMIILLDEPENVGWKICSQSDFHLTRFFFIHHGFFFFGYFCVLLNWSNISSNMAFLSCWMKCCTGFARP